MVIECSFGGGHCREGSGRRGNEFQSFSVRIN